MRQLLLLTALAVTGCATTRTVVADPYVALGQPPLDSKWVLTHVTVLPPTNPALSNHKFNTMLQQLEGHVREALVHETSLGEHVASGQRADYAVEVELRLIEGAAMNGYYGVAIGGAFAGPVAGALIGAAVGGPFAGATSIIGAAIGGAASIAASTVTPSETFSGQLEATLTVRRARDGVEIARRTSRASWETLINAYGIEEKLATAAGRAVPELEREMVRSLRDTFTSLEPGLEVAQAR